MKEIKGFIEQTEFIKKKGCTRRNKDGESDRNEGGGGGKT